MLCTKKTVFPAALGGLAPRLEEERWDQSLVDWPRVPLWLENRKNELLCQKWEESLRLQDLHPLPFQHP